MKNICIEIKEIKWKERINRKIHSVDKTKQYNIIYKWWNEQNTIKNKYSTSFNNLSDYN